MGAPRQNTVSAPKLRGRPRCVEFRSSLPFVLCRRIVSVPLKPIPIATANIQEHHESLNRRQLFAIDHKRSYSKVPQFNGQWQASSQAFNGTLLSSKCSYEKEPPSNCRLYSTLRDCRNGLGPHPFSRKFRSSSASVTGSA